MIVTKINAEGVDAKIHQLQEHLERNVIVEGLDISANWENNHRAYLNPQRNQESTTNYQTIEVYSENGEYRDVFIDNQIWVKSYFLVGRKREQISPDQFETDLSLIIQSNLDKVLPGVTHRADEEWLNIFHFALSKVSTTYPIKSIETEIDDVYRETKRQKLTLDNIGHRHVMRFNMNVRYSFLDTIDCSKN